MRHRPFLAAIAALSLAFAPLRAQAYSALYVFGDSLSDVGNVYLGTGSLEPVPPYANGQFSNGPVWAQDLSHALGLGVLRPFLAGGTDFAFGSATTANPATASSMVPNLTQQLGLFLLSTGGVVPASALYSVWIGGSDVLNILASGTTGPTAIIEAKQAAGSAASDIATLVGLGARKLLVPLLPDIGASPGAIASGTTVEGTLLAQTYNAALMADLGMLGSLPGVSIAWLDTFSLVDDVVADPAAYGFSDVTDPCYVGPYTGGGTVCATPDSYLFWDLDHPTAAGHALVAAQAYALVPEPGSFGLLGLGLTAAVLVRRRARCRA